MNILIVHRYFYPDSPTYAFLLYKLAKSFKTYFKNVTVLTSIPSYYGSGSLKNVPQQECLDGIHVRRLKLLPERNRNVFFRALNSVFFAFAVFIHLIFKGGRYDVVQVATTPPIISAMAVTLAGRIRQIRFVYHCQDIYPDITRAGKHHERTSRLYKLMSALDKYIMRNAWKIIVLSEDMKRHIVETRGIKPEKVAVINNFNFNRQSDDICDDECLPDSLKTALKQDRKKVIFAGNLGYFQNLEIIFRVIDRITKQNAVSFIVVGDGVRRAELEQKYKSPSIIFTGFLPNVAVQRIYASCQLGLAPVVAGIEKVAYPSKIISYSLAGLPVLTFSARKSSIESFVAANRMGDNYAFEGDEVLEGKILSILSRDFDRRQIKRTAQLEFGEQLAYEKWKNVYLGEGNR